MSFDLEKAIAAWRRPYEVNPAFSDEDLEELEGSLRDRVEALIDRGLPEKEAYHTARRRMGAYGAAETEYRKVYWGKVKRERRLGDELIWRLTMVKNYFTVALRNLRKQPAHALINILSLAVGMGACLVIFQYVQFELSYDKFHQNYQNTYRLIIQESTGNQTDTHPYIGYALGTQAKQEIPEIKEYVRKERFNRGAIVTNPINNNVFHENVNDLLFVDPSFFEVFNFPLTKGNKASLFEDKYSVVITEETASKYFGMTDPLGKILEIKGPPSPGTYMVTGVLEDPPLNSHLQFDFLIPIDNYIEYGWGGAVKEQGGWTGFSVITYLTLEESTDLGLVQDKLNQLIATNTKAQNAEPDIDQKVMLQPVADIYMKSGTFSDAGFLNITGNIQNIKIFSIISFFILFMAWVNYVNLSTAQSMQRSREVGVRKSLGAIKKQLISQFMLESALVNVLSAGLAIGTAVLLLPILNLVIGKDLELSVLQLPAFWGWFSIVVLLGWLLSGFYPAFVLSAFKPISLLGFNKTTGAGNINIRKGLIVFQFLTSLLLITGTYLIYKQTSFMKDQELGIDMEKIVVMRGPQVSVAGDTTRSRIATFRNELTGHSSTSEVAGSLFVPGQFWVSSYRKQGQPESAIPYSRTFYASLGFSKMYGLEFLAGGPFTENMPDEEVAIINEAAVSAYELGSPEKALQTRLIRGKRTLSIVGVVKNFHWHSLREAHTPYVVSLFNNVSHPYISVRVNTSNIREAVAHIESTYRSSFPGDPFEYVFADDAFNRAYQADLQFGKLFLAFTALAIFIACVGLFALISYSTNARMKEIGIRKVLGASTQNLMLLLSREYLIPLSIAIILAIPAILYWGGAWLENYAYRINIGFDLFIIPALILILISLLTVAYRMYNTVKTNPVESLRIE